MCKRCRHDSSLSWRVKVLSLSCLQSGIISKINMHDIFPMEIQKITVNVAQLNHCNVYWDDQIMYVYVSKQCSMVSFLFHENHLYLPFQRNRLHCNTVRHTYTIQAQSSHSNLILFHFIPLWFGFPYLQQMIDTLGIDSQMICTQLILN